MDKADILVGIASYNNAKTIDHVVRAVDAGLAKYFSAKKAVIVNFCILIVIIRIYYIFILISISKLIK